MSKKDSLVSSRDAWTILGEKVLFEAKPFVQVTRQHIVTSEGRDIEDYYQVLLADFAIVCAFTPSNEVITLWQYKHGSRRHGLTFPAGTIDGGESPEAAARRELMEETGYRAQNLRFLGRYALSGNQGCGFAHLFVAKDCVEGAEPCSGDLETMELKLMSISEVDAAVRTGEINILPHLAIWTTARANDFGNK
jgi:ADP-ribose pyrophosphatase